MVHEIIKHCNSYWRKCEVFNQFLLYSLILTIISLSPCHRPCFVPWWSIFRVRVDYSFLISLCSMYSVRFYLWVPTPITGNASFVLLASSGIVLIAGNSYMTRYTQVLMLLLKWHTILRYFISPKKQSMMDQSWGRVSIYELRKTIINLFPMFKKFWSKLRSRLENI